MATAITLQAYLDDLNTMLENESPTEVVSHCRYILQHYPQNVATYHLLGKALLQKGHHEGLKEYFDEAAEVFQRVLSVLPNDTTAHIGLSEIREQENAVDQAIWHLERAYEQMPGNAMLQEALRKLYTKRDGEDSAPSRIQLTRAALARQYASGHLYDQALVELRAALDQSPNRIDLQVLLAETLWAANHPLEAAEAAIQVLKKLPNCLVANRILAQLWLSYERPTDAQVFLDKLEGLDPYSTARLIQPDVQLPDTHRLPRLDYTARAAASQSTETPDWVQDLDDVGGMEDIFRAAPPAPPPDDAASEGPARIDIDALFAQPPQASTPPDWMKDVEMSSAAPEMPDWYGGMGGDFLSSEPPQPERSLPIGAEWLSEPASTGIEQPPSAPEVPDWFAEVMHSAPAAAATDQAPIKAEWLPSAERPEADDFFAAFDEATDAESAGLDYPPPERPASGFTDLLQGIETTRASTGLEPDFEEVEPIRPDWLTAFAGGEAVPPEAVISEPEVPEAGLAGWQEESLTAGQEMVVTDQAEAEMVWTGLDESAQFSAAAESAPEETGSAGEDAAWFAAFEEVPSETEPESASAEIEQFAAGVPEWQQPVTDAEEERLFGSELMIETGEPWGEVDLLAEEEDPMAWMRSLNLSGEAAPVEPELPSATALAELDALRRASMPPEDFDSSEFSFGGAEQAESPDLVPAEETPSWMTEPEYDFFAPSSEPVQPVSSSEEVEVAEPSDDWLADLRGVGGTEAIEELAAVEIPGWLHDAAPEISSSELEEPQAQKDEAPEEAEGWLADLRGTGSAEAVEELAAAEIPGWLQDARPEMPAQEAAGFEPPMQELSVAAEDWLGDLEGFGDAGLMEAPGEAVPDTPEMLPVDMAGGTLAESADSAAIQPPAFDDELMALFETQEPEALFGEDQAALPAVEEPAGVEQGVSDTLDWLPSAPAEDDWLQSFAKAEADEAAAEISGELSFQPALPGAEPETADWLSEMPEFEDAFGLQGAAGEVPADAEQELPLGWESQTTPPEAEISAALEESLTAGMAEDIWPSSSAMEAAPQEEISPAWLTELEPIQASLGVTEEQSELPDELADPFAAGRVDQAPAYQSAGDTGILQPGEEPDWMRAFAGEEGPLEFEEDQPAEQGEPDVLAVATDQGALMVDWSGLEAAEADVLDEAEPLFPSDQAMAGSAEPQATESDALAVAGEPAGDMPDWLVSIANSERDKLDDQFLEELETYGSAEDTGVLQPGNMPDWLTQMGDQPQAAQAGSTAEMASETPQVAQPGDLAHTMEAVTGSAAVEWGEEEQDEAAVSEDFAFEDQLPAWLRHPKENDDSARPAGGQGRPTETPEWLRTIFEDDESVD